MNTPVTNNSSIVQANKPKVAVVSNNEQSKRNPNHANPNPYLRRYGSHVKSHFSQSRCEFFESSEEENENQDLTKNTNNVNSLNHIGDIKTESKGNQSENNLNSTNPAQINHIKEGFLTVSGTMGKSPSIDSQNSPHASPKKNENIPMHPPVNLPTLNVNGESADLKDFTRKDSLELELEGMDDGEDDRKSALIIKSRRDSVSQNSFDSVAEKIEPEKEFLNKHFQNGKVVQPPKDSSSGQEQ